MELVRSHRTVIALLALALAGVGGCDGGGAGGAADDGSVGEDAGPFGDAGRADAGGTDGGTPDGGGSPGLDAGLDAGPCSGTVETYYVDVDGDGYTSGPVAVCVEGPLHPRYVEESLGEDCDDRDGRVVMSATAYVDADGDGAGAGEAQTVCVPPSGALPPRYASSGGDCDDAEPAAHPGLAEIPDDGIDNDCASGDAAVGDLADVVYVDADWTGPEAGTASEPYATLSQAVREASEGAVLALDRGAYFTSSTTDFDGKRLVLVGGYDRGAGWTRPGGPASTTIGTGQTETIRAGGADLTFANLTIDGPERLNAGLNALYGCFLNGTRLVLVDAAIDNPLLQEDFMRVGVDGVYANGGSVTLIRTRIEGNGARVRVNGTRSASSAAVAAVDADVRVVDSFLAPGSATSNGGDAAATSLSVFRGALHLYDSTLAGATADTRAPGAGNQLSARGLSVREAPAVVAGNTFRDITAQVTQPDHTRYSTVAQGLRAIGGDAQIVGNELGSITSSNDEGDAASWGIRLAEQTAWIADNRITRVNAQAGSFESEGSGTSTGIAVESGSTALLRGNFVGSGWVNVRATARSPTADAQALSVTGGSTVVSSGDVLIGQAVTTHYDGAASAIGRGLYVGGASSVVAIGDTIVGSATSGEGSAGARSVAVVVDGGTVLVGASALVPGPGDLKLGVDRIAGTIHLVDDAFVETDATFSALVRSGGTLYDLPGVNDCMFFTEGCGSETRGSFVASGGFVEPTGPVPARDYHLTADAALVDAVEDPTRIDLTALSLPAHAALPLGDLDGEPRPAGAAWDVGADERHP